MEQALSQLNDVVLITEAEPFRLPGPRIVYVNDAFERMSGYTAAEVLGQTPRILQGPRTARAELDRLNAAFGRWESCRVAVTNYRKDGRPFDVEFDVVPVADDRGWFTHWVSMQRDTTMQTVAAEIIARAETVDALVSGVLAVALSLPRSKMWSMTNIVVPERSPAGAGLACGLGFAAASPTLMPAPVDPVNDTISTSACAAIASPTTRPRPASGSRRHKQSASSSRSAPPSAEGRIRLEGR